MGEHIPSDFSMSTMSLFIQKKDVHGGKDCIKKFCKSLRVHAMKITDFKQKKMNLLTKEQQESCENAQLNYICKEKFEKKNLKINM